MDTTMQAPPATRWRRRTAVVVKVVVVAFLLFDAGTKVLQLAPVVEATTRIGYAAGAVAPIGLALLAITVLYVIPRTAAFGTVLLTGYLGGAVATQVRVGPVFSIVFPLAFAVLAWGATCWLDPRAWEVLFGRPPRERSEARSP